ncbi:MAG TPA: hypothetical protein VE397_15755 [Stellaceae bacterium]|nr:hypothetical protein [Stellaceae bacterium]
MAKLQLFFVAARKRIVFCAAILWLASAVAYSLVDNTYVSYPQHSEPEISRTAPYEVKGIVVYVTPLEKAVAAWVGRVFFASAAIVVVNFIGERLVRDRDAPKRSD